MKFTVKRELEVTLETAIVLDSQSKICNWLYNHLKELADSMRLEFTVLKKEQVDLEVQLKLNKKELGCHPKWLAREKRANQISLILYTKRGLRDLIPEIKNSKSFLKLVHAKPLKEAGMRLSRAIQSYQREQKKGNKAIGWPRFRKWEEDWFSLEYDETTAFNLKNNILSVSLGKNQQGKKITGVLKLKEPFPENLLPAIKTLKITKESSGRFFACFSVDDALIQSRYGQMNQPLIAQKIATIDPNHKNLGWLVSSDGRSIEILNPVFLKHRDIMIDELKTKRDACLKKSKKIVLKNERQEVIKERWQSSNRWHYLNNRLQEEFRLRREQKKTFLFTLAHTIYDQYELVAVGDYTPRGGGISTGMRRSMNHQSFIGQMKLIIEWVALKRNKHFYIYNEYRTSVTCCHCGFISKSLTLINRV